MWRFAGFTGRAVDPRIKQERVYAKNGLRTTAVQTHRIVCVRSRSYVFVNPTCNTGSEPSTVQYRFQALFGKTSRYGNLQRCHSREPRSSASIGPSRVTERFSGRARSTVNCKSGHHARSVATDGSASPCARTHHREKLLPRSVFRRPAPSGYSPGGTSLRPTVALN